MYLQTIRKSGIVLTKKSTQEKFISAGLELYTTGKNNVLRQRYFRKDFFQGKEDFHK